MPSSLNMRIGTAAAILLFAIASGLFVYSMVITPRNGSEVEQQGYRPPIQDQAIQLETRQPLQKSNGQSAQ